MPSKILNSFSRINIAIVVGLKACIQQCISSIYFVIKNQSFFSLYFKFILLLFKIKSNECRK